MQNTAALTPEPQLQIGTPLRNTWRMSTDSRRSLTVLCVLMAAMMALRHRAELLGLPEPLLVTLLQFSNAVTMLMWMRTDARLRGSPIPGGGMLMAAVLLPIAVPSYILWTRRWRGLAAIILSLIAILAAAIVGESAVRLALGVPIVVM
jgi:hypothetical protein